MKTKTLFDVKLPATGRHYDFWVPNSLTMRVVTSLVCEAMQIIEPDYYCAGDGSALMYARTGQIQNPNATVDEIGFANGDEFVLV